MYESIWDTNRLIAMRKSCKFTPKYHHMSHKSYFRPFSPEIGNWEMSHLLLQKSTSSPEIENCELLAVKFAFRCGLERQSHPSAPDMENYERLAKNFDFEVCRVEI